MSQAAVIHDFWLVGVCFLQLLHYALEQEQRKAKLQMVQIKLLSAAESNSLHCSALS